MRKLYRYFIGLFVLPSLICLLVMKGPDTTKEDTLVERIGRLEDHIGHYRFLLDELNQRRSKAGLWQKSFLGRNLTSNLNLYSGKQSLKSKFHRSEARSGVKLVIGIPTVYRPGYTYLIPTLNSVISSMNVTEKHNCLIVIYVGKNVGNYLDYVTSLLAEKYASEVESGLIDIVSPTDDYYPDFNLLPTTLGDSRSRFNWRCQQVLDFAWLMTHASAKGVYYLQLEDDVLATKGFVSTILAFTAKKTVSNKDWFVINYCKLGFIGKLFKARDLPHFVQFLVLFYTAKPVDWLLDRYLNVLHCRNADNVKECTRTKSRYSVFGPALFQHVGVHSSLAGKIQKAKDPKFLMPSIKCRNPANAELRTNISTHQGHTLKRLYKGAGDFWGVLPKKGHFIEFEFKRPVQLEKILMRTGTVKHPLDVILGASVQVRPANATAKCALKKDGQYCVVGKFDVTGSVQLDVPVELRPVSSVKLTFTANSANSVILRELCFKQTRPAKVRPASA